MPATPKSPTTAWLLWFFLGCFGGHRFYFEKKGSAFGMLGLFAGSFVLSAVGIGQLGFAALFCWWLADAYFMATKWMKDPAMMGGAAASTTAGSTGMASEREAA